MFPGTRVYLRKKKGDEYLQVSFTLIYLTRIAKCSSKNTDDVNNFCCNAYHSRA